MSPRRASLLLLIHQAVTSSLLIPPFPVQLDGGADFHGARTRARVCVHVRVCVRACMRVYMWGSVGVGVLYGITRGVHPNRR
jgi:hypothetical protein